MSAVTDLTIVLPLNIRVERMVKPGSIHEPIDPKKVPEREEAVRLASP